MNNKLIYRNNFDKSKNMYNLNNCIQLLNNNNNLEVVAEGNTSNIFYVKSPKCGTVVLKIIKKNFQKILLKREIEIIKMINNIIQKNQCPNLILTYYYNYNKKYILMEYADGHLSTFLKNEKYFNNKELLTIMNFQILYGLLTVQRILLGYHNDLHFKNIFYKQIDNSIIKYLQYNINDKIFIIPNTGFLFMLADYGNLQTLLFDRNNNWFNNNIILQNIKSNDDFKNLKTIYYHVLSRYIKKKYLIKSLDQLKNFINLYLSEENFNEFYKTIPEKYKNEIRVILELFISYGIEQKIFKLDKFLNKFIDPENSNIYMYSEEFHNFIKNIYNQSNSIEYILTKYFSNYIVNSEKAKSYNKNQIYKFNIQYEIYDK